MASSNQAVTSSPAALVGIAEGTRYSVQNLGAVPVYLAVAAAEPDAGDRAFVARPLGWLYARAEAGESLWVWTAAGSSHVAYEEAA